MVLLLLWVGPGIGTAVGALAASDDTADTGAEVVGEAGIEADDAALPEWAVAVDQGASVEQLGLEFYAEVVGLYDYWLVSKS